MLELKNIKKQYKMLDGEITNALNGVSIKFRQSEFVSILGPSGCGKTTLLNIVGGLDKYTTGDLVIDGVSTKNYTDRDWDAYRNYKIGFIFQSYNLIPHLSVVENVELALTLSGITKKEERRKKAIAVLKKVGLKDKIKSKPNQLSGGQMQRVAIARALVNDPEIILADEPTGALDSKTSVQIMELLKEISSDKLIIMVTHNPELATSYSSRIVSLLDGKVVDDTNPYTDEEVEREVKEDITPVATSLKNTNAKGKKLKTKMSFWTAISLSFKNLLTKKARTLLVSFAGSIGIIGIALILSLSSGFQSYINKTQEDTLSSYPITISQTNSNMLEIMMSMFQIKNEIVHEDDAVYGSDTMSDLFDKASSSFKANDLKSFKEYIEDNYGEISKYVSGIKYTYDISLEQQSSLMSMSASNNKLVTVYSLSDKKVYPTSSALMDMIVMYARTYLESDYYINTEISGTTFTLKTSAELEPKTMDNPKYKKAYNFISPHIGEVKTNELFVGGQTTLTMTEFLTIISKSMGIPLEMLLSYRDYNLNLFKEMIENQKLINSQYDVLSGDYPNNENQIMLVLNSKNELEDYILYALGLISDDDMRVHMQSLFTDSPTTIKINYDKIVGKKFKLLMNTDYYDDYYATGNYVDLRELLKDNTITQAEFDAKMAGKGRELTISGVLKLNEKTSSGILDSGLCYTPDLTRALLKEYNENPAVLKGDFERATTVPTAINFYAQTFEAKQGIENFIKAYNDAQTDEDKKIDYSDYIGLMMSSISTIINAISYVLIAFVSISLVVSSIMIGIITYISVLERTKEIGVLRSIGASKRDIKNVFVSESVIIGFVAGVLGILITVILNIPINIIINSLADIGAVAHLPIVGAVILVAVSVFLTFIAGLIPARVASKKDPVIALRTE